MSLDPRYDEEDLEYLDPFERSRALGLDPDDTIRAEEQITHEGTQPIEIHRKKPVDGRVEFRLAEIARDRGIVHKSGEHKGKVNVMALHRGTDLAYCTILPLLHKSGDIRMIYMETISRLCSFLQCKPGDLFEYIPYHRSEPVLSEQYKRG